jgi:SNF2 family DNA or RNA helicase
MLEFSFGMEGIDPRELPGIFRALREKKKYYQLKNGSFLKLDSKEMDKVADFLDYLELDKTDFQQDFVAIPKYRAVYLDQKIRDSQIHFLERNSAFKELVQNIREPEDMDFPLPAGIRGTLREYQKFGYKWLKTLSRYGLGGILADDMGLGKTLQVITLILSDRLEKGPHPSLVVVSTSLVYNWCAEVEKFAPQLRTVAISGSKAERARMMEEIGASDLVVTSYPLIRRDIEEYKKLKFRYCILDEAQHIKNPGSVNARSVKEIKAERRFALTGTPMENSLTELPKKIENRMVAELTEEQKKVYLAYLQRIRSEIEREIAESGFERSQIRILAGLTRLRQICCHPSLFLEDYRGESGKMQLLEEIVLDSIESGHRMLLFSQFTGMLHMIENWLKSEKIDYMYLDGSTPGEDRGRMVKNFNEGQGKVFLISLKAGGTGLNLTGADVVLHFDPWWNPSVEDQATDRAYRIGQKKAVHVIKLITKGTIEEKIFKLQEKKKELIDAVIHPGETLLTKMTQEEIRSLFE